MVIFGTLEAVPFINLPTWENNMLESLHDALVTWLAQGLWVLPWWGKVIFTLVVTHITIASVTIFLHRAQAHRALDLHAIPSHFFRLWLWLTTGMLTKEWVAIHRKHHAKCETVDDPHSPVTRGIKTVLLTGSELYRAEAKNPETLARYGHNTPDDWIEHNLYSRFSWQGVGLMLIVDLVLFGAIGATVWAVQMAWIPVSAAGIVNGLGHYWGYRNFEPSDASTNLSPWGVIIGGEELHNNHHTYPTSAKLSVKPYEFDIGWLYIRLMEMVGWAKVKKVPPRLALGAAKTVADDKTLEAIIANRYELMALYAAVLRRVVREEAGRLRERGVKGAPLRNMQFAQRWVARDDTLVPSGVMLRLRAVLTTNAHLTRLVTMRDELRQLWTRTNVSAEQLVADLQVWCKNAETSGIDALAEFSRRLRAVR